MTLSQKSNQILLPISFHHPKSSFIEFETEMKEEASSNNPIRTSSHKEKTRLRERQRRSISTNIFNGLRKHGGYHLSPRADINQVLRHLAQEAGWVVEPDGTTYRSRTPTTTTTTTIKGFDLCPVCGAGRRSRTSTPTSSYIATGGDCSTGSLTISDPTMVFGVGASTNVGIPSTSNNNLAPENALGMYMYGGTLHHQPIATGVEAAYHHNQQLCLKEAKASNQNTPVGSPPRLDRTLT